MFVVKLQQNLVGFLCKIATFHPDIAAHVFDGSHIDTLQDFFRNVHLIWLSFYALVGQIKRSGGQDLAHRPPVWPIWDRWELHQILKNIFISRKKQQKEDAHFFLSTMQIHPKVSQKAHRLHMKYICKDEHFWID